MPNVSVVIPCYNSEKYIGRCLQALEEQSYRDFEVIVVDDCSTDNTAKIIEQNINRGVIDIHYLKNKINMGPCESRNIGIAISKANYISFCDSDDWYEKEYLQLMCSQAQICDADIVFCNSQKIIGKDRKLVVDNIGLLNKKSSVKEIMAHAPDSLCAMMVKRKIISDIKQPNIRNGEDMAIIPLLVMHSKKFEFVYEHIYNYLCRPGSLSLSYNSRAVDSLRISYDFICKNQIGGFEAEVEFIGIKNLIYGALLNIFRFSYDTITAKEILSTFEFEHPDWNKNMYIKKLSLHKRLFVYFAKHRWFRGIQLMCRIHRIIVKG